MLLGVLACKPEAEPPVTPNLAAAPEPETEPEPPAEPETAPTCAEAPGWRYERIELPPEFAPTLPAGVETLWFAPGMFDPAAPDYFTYAFSLDWMDEQAPKPTTLEGWLTEYFVGLMSAVAGSRQAEPVALGRVEVEPNGAKASVVMSDEFTGTPEVQLTILVSGDANCLRLHATANPTPENLAALAAADACLCGR